MIRVFTNSIYKTKFIEISVIITFASIAMGNAKAVAALPKKTGCVEQLQQLKQMREAYASVQNGLIENHELAADSLDSYSDALKSTAGRSYKVVETNMNRSAKALRDRADKAKIIASKLSEQTDILIREIESCQSK